MLNEIEEFRSGLSLFDDLQVVQRFITVGDCSKVTGEHYRNLRAAIAEEFNVNPSNVFVVGSAKLGFSISPSKRWIEFGDHSDIDVAIVSSELYLRMWRQIGSLINADPSYSWDKKVLLGKKHLTGWLRPDAFPPSEALPLASEWFDFFNSLSGQQICGPYKVNAGLYHDIEFLENYQRQAVALCKSEEAL